MLPIQGGGGIKWKKYIPACRAGEPANVLGAPNFFLQVTPAPDFFPQAAPAPGIFFLLAPAPRGQKKRLRLSTIG